MERHYTQVWRPRGDGGWSVGPRRSRREPLHGVSNHRRGQGVLGVRQGALLQPRVPEEALEGAQA